MNPQGKGKIEWSRSMPLACPSLRYNEVIAGWVALENDPCPKCNGNTGGFGRCHNAGKPFNDPKRFLILYPKNKGQTYKQREWLRTSANRVKGAVQKGGA